MKKSDFYYELPKELIAQHPLEDRSSSRLLYVNKESGDLKHLHFRDIVEFLKPGDCLVLNNTKVLPARLYGRRQDTGAVVEVLLLRRRELMLWEVLVKPGKKARPGMKLVFGEGELRAEVVDIVEEGNRLIRFACDGVFEEVLDRIGQMPLPPYITEKLEDQSRYQTVYAKEEGSSAAPTAGLHFTPQLLEQVQSMGVRICYVTLHVGLGTFRPVKEENILDHHMHTEWYEITPEAADTINKTKEQGGRVICVGTTSVRTLESAARKMDPGDGVSGSFCDPGSQNDPLTPSPGSIWGVEAKSGDTDIFIYPGYEFKIPDGLITNFHLPESTLIMLVSALAGREHILHAYEEAVREKYRFFSFGDAMLIL